EKLQEVAELLFNDAMEDFEKDEELMNKYEELPEKQKDIIKARGKSAASKVAREYALNVYKVDIKKPSHSILDADEIIDTTT
ncbi:16125_t:CDS:1, partial [Acaulospora morrowiae]